jgi:hypothetical protein
VRGLLFLAVLHNKTGRLFVNGPGRREAVRGGHTLPDNKKGHQKPAGWWPKFASYQTRPCQQKGRAHDLNDGIAMTALICVKSPNPSRTNRLSCGNFVFNCTNYRCEDGPASATGDYL